MYIVNSGLIRLENGYEVLYEPGTQRERAYMRGLSIDLSDRFYSRYSYSYYNGSGRGYN
jgi:hypothetical protein